MPADSVDLVSQLSLRLDALRGELDARGLDGFIIPRGDEFMGEYVPPSAERLEFISGFTGSAGLAIVLKDAAAVFTDGRYTIQVRDQSPAELFDHGQIPEENPMDWAKAKLADGAKLGFDSRLHTLRWTDQARRKLETGGITLTPVSDNPVDKVWTDRPAEPGAPFTVHDIAYTGRDSADKLAEIGKALADKPADAFVITQPDSLAWLLNIRGHDVPFTPLPLAFAVLHQDQSVDLFADAARVPDALKTEMGDKLRLHPPSDFGAFLEAFDDRVVMMDQDMGSAWVYDRLKGSRARVLRDADPIALPKAIKTEAERNGSRAAHRRDGVALCRFLAWLDRAAQEETVTELAAVDKLLAFRRQQDLFREPSFDTISGSGPNGAIVHYRVTPETDRVLQPGDIFLLDSGGQYLDGTTDVTRTVLIGGGMPTEAMKSAFTGVLKGHIGLDRAVFPDGTTGSQLDVLARLPLWEMGLDFDHGTGHGVGSYLSVHEGPQRIGKAGNRVALKPGMVLSNEPGYYEAGGYGIRIENLVMVTEAAPIDGDFGDSRPMMQFETLTLAPIDRRLIDVPALSAVERKWLDDYHARVLAEIGPHLDGADLDWLKAATAPLEAPKGPSAGMKPKGPNGS